MRYILKSTAAFACASALFYILAAYAQGEFFILNWHWGAQIAFLAFCAAVVSFYAAEILRLRKYSKQKTNFAGNIGEFCINPKR